MLFTAARVQNVIAVILNAEENKKLPRLSDSACLTWSRRSISVHLSTSSSNSVLREWCRNVDRFGFTQAGDQCVPLSSDIYVKKKRQVSRLNGGLLILLQSHPGRPQKKQNSGDDWELHKWKAASENQKLTSSYLDLLEQRCEKSCEMYCSALLILSNWKKYKTYWYMRTPSLLP